MQEQKEFANLNQERIDEVISLSELLENSENEEFIIENLPRFLSMLEETLNVELTNDVNSLYDLMREENCLGRIEHVSKIVGALEKEIPFEIGIGKGDSHYANAVIPDEEGIRLAFGEGQAPGPLRIMVGFGKAFLGFKTDNIEVNQVDFSEDELRDFQKRSYLCRHVDGNISKKDIRTVVMRIPRGFMKDDSLFDEEKGGKTPFIFRGFSAQ